MNTLISVKDEMSLSVIAGASYPLVEVTPKYAVIATTDESSANSIGARVGGDVHETPLKDFPFEVHIDLEKFDKIIEAQDWSEIVTKYFV